MAVLVAPLLVVVGLETVTHGQISPGGGFQGGVVVASAIYVMALSGNLINITPGTLIELVGRMNRYACTNSQNGRRFTTAFIAEYDPATGGFTLTFAIDEGALYRFCDIGVTSNVPAARAAAFSV